MKPMTRWYRLNKVTGFYEPNHIEDGHIQTDAPTVTRAEQVASWSGAKWRKQFGYLDDNGVFQHMRTG